MVRILLITLFSTVSVFSGEFLDLKIEGSYSVLKRENASPFLTNEHIVAMGLGNIWKLRPSRKDEKDRATVELFIKTIARHAYAERSPLTFNMFEALWDSTQDAALKEHFGCIHGIILTSHLLKSTIHHNDDDSRILSKLKNRFNDKARQKFLEWSYNNLEKSEKQKKKFTYERIKELLAAKELSREQFLVFMNENCCAAELNEKPMQAISRLSITGVMENIEGAFRDKKYPYGEIRGVLGQVYALDNPHEILGIEDRIVHFICNMNDEALKTEMVEEILTRAVEYDCPALRAALINNCCLDVEAIEECKATTLGTAARTGNIKVVRELLGLHTDVNRMYGFKRRDSLICDAVWSGCGTSPVEDVRLPTQFDIVKLFIQAGADPNIIFKGDYSNPILMSLEDPQITALLMQSGANIDARNDEGKTLLMIRAGSPYLDHLRKLIQLKANVHLEDPAGFTALHFAVYEGGSGNVCKKLEMINDLIKYGAKINAKTHCGLTPCHMAANSPKGSSKFLHALLKYGAMINSLDNNGQTVLLKMIRNFVRHAYSREFSSTGDANFSGITFLIENGADINAADLAGKKPLDLIPDVKTRKDIFNRAKEHPWYHLMIFTRRFQNLGKPLYANLEAGEVPVGKKAITTVFCCDELMHCIYSFLFITK